MVEDDFRKEEWNFSEHAVPDDEVRACLIWECGRECEELWLAEYAELLEADVQPEKWDQSSKQYLKNPKGIRERARDELADLDFDLDGYKTRLFQCHQVFNQFYETVIQFARPWSTPWQGLSHEVRTKAVGDLNDFGIYPPIRPSLLGELESLWNLNGKMIIDIKSGAIEPQFDDTLDMLAFDEAKPIEVSRDERDPGLSELTFSATINFTLFTDKEIAESFREWLKSARTCAEPRRRGKKLNDDRAALEGIGIMRAFSHFTFSDPRFPEALRKRGRRACDKGRDLARRRFHEIFPFLLAESDPINWKKFRVSAASKSD